MHTLRPYQAEALKALERNASGLLADGLGLGKTLVAVEHVKRLKYKRGARILYIAPLNTHQNVRKTFLRQFKSLTDRPDLVRICGTPKSDPNNWRRMVEGKSGVFIIGWEAMRGQGLADSDTGEVLIDMKGIWRKTGIWDVVVADEVHRIQNRKSKTKEIISSIRSRHRLALSGTPAGNKAQGIWSVYNWLWPELYPSFWDWVRTHFHTSLQSYRGRRVFEIQSEKSPGAIFKDAPCVIRRRAEDVLEQLPEAVERVVRVPMTPTQERIYKDFEQQAFAWLKDQPVATPLPLVQRMRLRQTALAEPSAIEIEETGEQHIFFEEDTTAPKIDALKEIISDLPEDEPVLVFTHLRKFAEIVKHQLGREAKAVLLPKAQAKKRRQTVLDTFGKPGGPRILIAIIESISEGVDGLQDVCNNEVWLSQSDSRIMNEQATGRLERSGQKRLVNRWYIRTENTIDERVYERLEEGREEMARFYHDVTEED